MGGGTEKGTNREIEAMERGNTDGLALAFLALLLGIAIVVYCLWSGRTRTDDARQDLSITNVAIRVEAAGTQTPVV